MLPVALRALSRRRDEPLVSRLRRRVTPCQIDINLHMNQAAYAQMIELGRIDWALRSGALQHCRDQGIHPVVAEQTIVYRRELRPGTAYELDTRAVGVDGRLLVLESHLVVGGRVHATGTVKMIFVGSDGVLAPGELPPLVEPYLVEPRAMEDWQVV